ncbi:aldo/keto reductase [Actinomyces sp. ZJ308]|uniref:aldo/keto reductase n=1 Tax=Actinomyces sp. ZJ308 TaxID=2708342 RepID=UPI00141E6BCD|nr:aldo/keto reductase [Actinomyces sp. ZJ308]
MTGTPTRALADLQVSPIGLGGNVFGWTADEATSFEVLDAYLDAGGNLVDTADGYSFWAPGNSGGESESVIGSWLASRPVRDRIVLATKVSTKPDRPGLSADNIRLALEESLSRLRTDVVDIYYAHFDDESTALEETVVAFEEARRAGMIRHVGLSNYTPERIRQWFAIADSEGCARPIVLQPHYNLLHRDDVEGSGGRGQAAAELGMGLMPYFALAAGFLTGKYRRGEVIDGDRAGMVADYQRPECYDVVDALIQVAADHAVEPSAVALAWLRDRPGVTAPLASARSLSQLRPIMDALTLDLSAEETRALTRVSDAARS